MATPIVEQIAVNVEATVAAITTANGFEHTLIAERPNMETFTRPRHLLALIWQGDPTKTDSRSNDKIDWEQPFYVSVYYAPKDDEEIDTALNQVRSDIQKKFLEDRYRSDLALNTLVGDPFFFEFEDGSMFGITTTILVRYRVLETDPYTKG